VELKIEVMGLLNRSDFYVEPALYLLLIAK
jgi:hypothetical protein